MSQCQHNPEKHEEPNPRDNQPPLIHIRSGGKLVASSQTAILSLLDAATSHQDSSQNQPQQDQHHKSVVLFYFDQNSRMDISDVQESFTFQVPLSLDNVAIRNSFSSSSGSSSLITLLHQHQLLQDEAGARPEVAERHHGKHGKHGKHRKHRGREEKNETYYFSLMKRLSKLIKRELSSR